VINIIDLSVAETQESRESESELKTLLHCWILQTVWIFRAIPLYH